MAKAPAGKKNAPAPAPVAAAAEATKSIINPKYAGKYKDPANHDQLTKLLNVHAVTTKTVEKKVKDAEGDGHKMVKSEVADGVNVDALFTIAGMNHLDVDAYKGQRDSAGFPGRFRMTVANMLRASMRKRHGIFVPDAKGKPEWVTAEPDFLKLRGAPEKPTHNKDGSKIVVAKETVEA